MKYLLVFIVLALVVTSILGQDITASIQGTISDTRLDALPGAKVFAVNTATGLKRETLSDEKGNYTLPVLPVGVYEVVVTASGFRRHVQQVTLSLNQETRINVELQLGDISESVEVAAESGILNSENGSVGQIVGRRKIDELPLNGRNFLQLAVLQAGVTPGAPTISEFTPAHPGQVSFTANGMRQQSNNFLLDGVDNNDAFLGTAAAVPSPDALQEFRILTNAYSAEYGRGAGAIVNVISRSGANEFHGSAYEYFRDDFFDARNFFSADVPKLEQHQFGGTVGGPIRRNKAFFFGSYEGFRRVQEVTAAAVVLSSLQRQGNFGPNARIRDPLGSGNCNATETTTCFPNGIIPIERFSPIARKLLQLIPEPNRGESSLVSAGQSRSNSDQFLSRIDHSFTDNNNFSARYFFQNGYVLNPFTNLPPITVPGFPFEDKFRFQNLVISDTHVFSPNLIYEVRFGQAYSRLNYNVAHFDIDRTALGFTYPIVGTPNLPLIFIPGFTFFGTSFDSNALRRNDVYQLKNHLTYIRGRHKIKGGVELFRNLFSLQQDGNNSGTFAFRGGVTGNAIADFLLGRATAFTQTSPSDPAYFSGTLFQTYIQDDFQINKRLTLNIGLRYDLELPISERHDRMVAFRPGTQSGRFPNAPVGLLFQGDPGRDQIIRTDKNNFAPRIGFAWDIFGDSKTSLRGGYGIYYDVVLGALYGGSITATPFTVSVDGTTPGNLADPFSGASPFNGTVTPTSFFPPLISLTIIDPNLESPYNQQWNLSIQREITRDFVVEAGYVGTKGTHLPGTRVLNTAVFTSNATVQNINSRRPYAPAFGQILNYQSTFNSNYHALQLTANKRMSCGLSVLAAYTFSKTIDDGSFPTGRRGIRLGTYAQDPNNLRAERGLSLIHVAHRFVMSYLYELPLFRSREDLLGRILGGWQINGITTLSTGKPISIQDSSDPNVDGSGQDRPDVLYNPNLPRNRRSVDRFWDVDAFVRVPARTNRFGNSGRNIVIGPGYNNTDISLFKTFPIQDKFNLQLRWEIFNIFNTPNFENPGGGAPSNDIASPIFGSLQNTVPNSERIMQFALRFSFKR